MRTYRLLKYGKLTTTTIKERTKTLTFEHGKEKNVDEQEKQHRSITHVYAVCLRNFSPFFLIRCEAPDAIRDEMGTVLNRNYNTA